MSSLNNSHATWLSLALGRKLNQALALVHCLPSSSIISSIQSISLEFEGRPATRIFCGINGASIDWDNHQLEPFEMGEYGEEKVVNLANIDPSWSELLNQKLNQAFLIRSEVENSIFAIHLVFSNELEVSLANLGDELVLLNRLSPRIIDEEKAEFLTVLRP